jgi:hypothetical protein
MRTIIFAFVFLFLFVGCVRGTRVQVHGPLREVAMIVSQEAKEDGFGFHSSDRDGIDLQSGLVEMRRHRSGSDEDRLVVHITSQHPTDSFSRTLSLSVRRENFWWALFTLGIAGNERIVNAEMHLVERLRKAMPERVGPAQQIRPDPEPRPKTNPPPSTDTPFQSVPER